MYLQQPLKDCSGPQLDEQHFAYRQKIMGYKWGCSCLLVQLGFIEGLCLNSSLVGAGVPEETDPSTRGQVCVGGEPVCNGGQLQLLRCGGLPPGSQRFGEYEVETTSGPSGLFQHWVTHIRLCSLLTDWKLSSKPVQLTVSCYHKPVTQSRL